MYTNIPEDATCLIALLRQLQDLSDEQKVILIKRELSGCTVEEAMNSLEACCGDVDAAVAMLSQVLRY